MNLQGWKRNTHVNCFLKAALKCKPHPTTAHMQQIGCTTYFEFSAYEYSVIYRATKLINKFNIVQRNIMIEAYPYLTLY